MLKENNYPQPFLKWVGGKRQLLDRIKERLPEKFENYYEPFIGGGAVFFNLELEKDIYINDVNKELINTYIQLKNSYKEVLKKIDELNSVTVDQERYTYLRNLFNEKIVKEELDIESAALFMLINKYCFNGVYRVNKKGLYNVPWNKKSQVEIYNKENIHAVSRKLKNVHITVGDFLDVTKTANKKDFIFFDSPYAPLNDTSFDSYTKTGFLKEDHIRLAEEFKRLDKLGAYVMLTNHNTELIRELYSDYNIEVVDVKRMVNSDAKNRIGKEVIIRNY